MKVRAELLLLVACGSAPPPSNRDIVYRTFHHTVRDDLGQAQPLLDCGEVKVSFDEAKHARCFEQAFRTCRPAQLRGSDAGIDSGPFLWSATVVPNPAKPAQCEIRLYQDSRNDSFGEKSIVRSRCDLEQCEKVWTESHEFCHTFVAPVNGTIMGCAAMPPAVEWSKLPSNKPRDLTARIEQDLDEDGTWSPHKTCESAADYLHSKCFTDAFARCEPTWIHGRDWAAAVTKECKIHLYTSDERSVHLDVCKSLHQCERVWDEPHELCREGATKECRRTAL